MSSDEPPPELAPHDGGHISQPENVSSPAAVATQQATATATANTAGSAPFESESINDYTILRRIGEGAFGIVCEAQHNRDKQLYAIKKVDVVRAKRAVKKLLREVQLMAKLDHPNIVKYHNAWPEELSTGEELSPTGSNLRYFYIRMELCRDQDLRKWLKENQLPDQRPISQTLDWFSQLASAVKYIHDAGLMHRDIKPENIFFGSPPNEAAPVLKIGDFGLAIDVAPSSHSEGSGGIRASVSNAGTPIYMSPEQSFGPRYTRRADIFSLGLVFLEMLHPFKTKKERYADFLTLQSGKRPDVMDELDGEMNALISRMTAFKSEKRATASELVDKLKKMVG